MPLEIPLVSICIPAYNSGKYICATLESILKQTYSNLEIIITDDHSVDNTCAIVEAFKDPRIKLFRNEANLGVPGNWNRSIELANGDFIKIMGADDILAVDCIEKQVSILCNPVYDQISLVTSYKNVIDKNGKLLFCRKTFNEIIISGKSAIKLSLIDGTNLIGEPVAGLFRKSDFDRIGGYKSDFKYLIDLEFWNRLISNSHLYLFHEPLYSFRLSGNSLSRNLIQLQKQEYVRFFGNIKRAGLIHFSILEKWKAMFNITLKGWLRWLVLQLF